MTVNFAGASAVTSDDDPTCTGTNEQPTAPAGKVCLYSGSLGEATSAGGFGWHDVGVDLQARAFFAEYRLAPADVATSGSTGLIPRRDPSRLSGPQPDARQVNDPR